MGGHEGKAGQRHRQGQERQGCCLPWIKSEDRFWPDQGQAHQEQIRQDCVQSNGPPHEETGCHEGEEDLHEGLEPQRLRCRWRQVGYWQGALCQGQGAAQVNVDVCVRSCCPCSALAAWDPRGKAMSRRCKKAHCTLSLAPLQKK